MINAESVKFNKKVDIAPGDNINKLFRKGGVRVIMKLFEGPIDEPGNFSFIKQIDVRDKEYMINMWISDCKTFLNK